MKTMDDIIFDVTTPTNRETITFVNISYEKIQQAMLEAFESTNVLNAEIDEAAREVFLQELANRLNTKGNTITWRGKTMKMNFSVE